MKKSKTIGVKRISETQTPPPEYGPNGLSPRVTKAHLARIAKIKRKSAKNWKREEAEMKKKPLPAWINDLYPIPIDADFFKALARIEAIKSWCIGWCKSHGKQLMGRPYKVDIASLQRQVINTAGNFGPGLTMTQIARLWEDIWSRVVAGDMAFLTAHEKIKISTKLYEKGIVQMAAINALDDEGFTRRPQAAQLLGMHYTTILYHESVCQTKPDRPCRSDAVTLTPLKRGGNKSDPVYYANTELKKFAKAQLPK